MNDIDSGEYKNIYYSVQDDCGENKGGYYIEFFNILDNKTMEIDFDDRLDYMVIHANDEYEMKNAKKVIENYIDNSLIKEKEKNMMNKKEIISQLKDLQRDAKTRIDKDDPNDISRADYEALEEAIKIIENNMLIKEYEILNKTYLVYIKEKENFTEFYISEKDYGIIEYVIGLDLNNTGKNIEDFINDNLIEWIYHYNEG